MDKALQTMINNMPEKTGKSLADWKQILQKKNFRKHSEGVKFLKNEHKVTHGFANTIVTLSKEECKTCLILREHQIMCISSKIERELLQQNYVCVVHSIKEIEKH